MSAPRQETFVRLTDIVADLVARRLGLVGTTDLADFVARVEAQFAAPLEVHAQTPISQNLAVETANLVLGDGRKVGVLRDGNRPAIAAGTINFTAGTISTGAVSSFTRPNMTASRYVFALVQFRGDTGALNVTFGTQATSPAAAGSPAILPAYEPICLVQLFSTGGGIGVFDAIPNSSITVLPYGLTRPAPWREDQTVITTPQTVFTLTTIVIPADRSRLTIQVNGVNQLTTDYTVDSESQVTMAEAQPVNAVVTFKVS